ncbi:MAG: hypothetical protein FJY74_07475 [Candidatus Eisenbacteria bacterium]|nr:hypothetical protein [Candidatus Eisenbacteria bacterium]
MIGPFVMGAIGMLTGFAMVVLIVFTVFKHASTESRRKQEVFNAALEKGVYDPALLGRAPSRRSTAALGWGFIFIAIGLALFVGFVTLGILADAIIGALVPLFMGIALVLYHRARKSLSAGENGNGKPIQIAKQEAPRAGGDI